MKKKQTHSIVVKMSFKSTGLLMTEPYMNLKFIRETMDQIFFEEYDFASFARYDRKISIGIRSVFYC